MKLYCCGNTNEIKEKTYNYDSCGFCIVEKYEYAYQKELPRFKKFDCRIYGLPYEYVPQRQYLGIGNRSVTKDNSDWGVLDFPKSEVDAEEIYKLFYDAESCDLVWVRIHGSSEAVPDEYEFCGYDLTFVPDIEGAFSIINDCMFICKWHGCDDEGTAFADYFAALNGKGLFNDAQTTLDYMNLYLSFNWSERGEFCICEIYRKNLGITGL